MTDLQGLSCHPPLSSPCRLCHPRPLRRLSLTHSASRKAHSETYADVHRRTRTLAVAAPSPSPFGAATGG
eukprot:2034632-Pyramimonas_sp.AAC.1